MTFRVMRELSTNFAAAAPVAGADWLTDTTPVRPVPFLYITGTADPLNPFEGGEIFIGRKSFGTKPSIKGTIKGWLKLHGCSSKGRVVYKKDGATGIGFCLPGKAAKSLVRFSTTRVPRCEGVRAVNLKMLGLPTVTVVVRSFHLI